MHAQEQPKDPGSSERPRRPVTVVAEVSSATGPAPGAGMAAGGILSLQRSADNSAVAPDGGVDAASARRGLRACGGRADRCTRDPARGLDVQQQHQDPRRPWGSRPRPGEDPSRATTAAQPGLGPTHRSTATRTTTRAGGCSPVETPSSPSAEGVRDTRDPVPPRPGRGRAAARHGPRPSANHRQPAERPDAPRTQAQLPRVPDGIAQFLPRITAVIRRDQAQAELAEEGKRWESAP
jgi:hypothetical protein